MQNGKKAMSPGVSNGSKDQLTNSSPMPASNYSHLRTGSSIGLPSPSPVNTANRGISSGRSPLPNSAGSKIPVLASADPPSQRNLFNTRTTSSPSTSSIPRLLSPTHSKARSISANPLSQTNLSSARENQSNDQPLSHAASSSMLQSIDDENSQSEQRIQSSTNPLSTRSEAELPSIVESSPMQAVSYPTNDIASSVEQPLSPTDSELEPLSPRTRAARVLNSQQRKQSLSSNSNAADPDLLFPTKIAFMRTTPKKPVSTDGEEPLSPKSPRSPSISSHAHQHMRNASALPISQTFALPALHDDQLDDFDVDLTLDSPIRKPVVQTNNTTAPVEPVQVQEAEPHKDVEEEQKVETVQHAVIIEPVAAVQHTVDSSSRRPSDVDTFGNVWPPSTPTFSNDTTHHAEAPVAIESSPQDEQVEENQLPVEQTVEDVHRPITESATHSPQPSELSPPEVVAAVNGMGLLLSSDDDDDDSLDISLNSNKENEHLQSHDLMDITVPVAAAAAGLDSTIVSPVGGAPHVQPFAELQQQDQAAEHQHTPTNTEQKDTAAAVEELQQMAATVEPIGTSAAVHSDDGHAATASVSAKHQSPADVHTAVTDVAAVAQQVSVDPQPTARPNVRQDSIDLGFDDDEELDGFNADNRSTNLSLDIDEPAGEVNSTQTQQQQAFADVQVKLRAMEAQRRATTQQFDDQKGRAVEEAEKLTQPDPQLVNEQQQLQVLAVETESLRRMSTIDTKRHATELEQSSNMQMEYCIAGLQYYKIPFNRGSARLTTIKLTQAPNNQWYVSWLSKRKKPEHAQILINNATLALNQSAGIFKHPKQGSKWRQQFSGDSIKRSFSIVTSERSLDLVAEKSDDYDAFVSVFRKLPFKSIVDGKQ